MKLYFKNFFLVFLFFLFAPILVFSRIGVGVGSGKIVFDTELKPGGIYDLPSLPVLNTGDVVSGYGLSIEYHEGQEKREDMGFKPERDWFTFEPAKFQLNPQEVKAVGIKLSIPVKTIPGKYFAYIEAHPIQAGTTGSASVGIAAAAKLYFRVAPANIFQGLYYRIAFFMARYAPWTYTILILIVVAIAISILRKYVSFNIGIRKK